MTDMLTWWCQWALTIAMLISVVAWRDGNSGARYVVVLLGVAWGSWLIALD